jgi:hypothetical protein
VTGQIQALLPDRLRKLLLKATIRASANERLYKSDHLWDRGFATPGSAETLPAPKKAKVG